MKKKLLVTLVSLVLTLSMVLGILVGCGGGAATPTATVPGATVAPGATPGATAPAPGVTQAAPTPPKGTTIYKWRFQSGSAAGTPTWWLFKEQVERIKIASGGRLLIDFLAAGSIVGPMEIVDAVSTGAIEAGSLSDATQGGKNELFDLTGQISANFMPQVLYAWYFYGSPEEPMYPKNIGRGWTAPVWAKYFNVHWIPHSISITEVEYNAQKPLLKPEDYKGLKYRGLAYTQKVVAELGAAPIFVWAGDLFSAIQTGVVDAMELSNPALNEAYGIHAVTKYMGFPGMHTLSQTGGFGVNLDVWKKLPADLQMIVELATDSVAIKSPNFYLVESVKVMDEVAARGKPLVTYLTPEMQQMWYEASFRIADKQADASKFVEFKPMWEDMKKFQYMFDRYLDIGLQTPNFGPDYPGQKSRMPGILGLTK